jgi:propionyl-CoA carboxylase alpha chain
MLRNYRDRAAQIDGQLQGRERRVPEDWVVIMNGEHHPVSILPADGGYDVSYEGNDYAVRSDWQLGQILFSGTVNGSAIAVQVQRHNQTYRLSHDGHRADITILTPREAELMKLMPVKAPPDTSRHLLAPMPGLLVSVAVKPGDEVKAGEELAVLEAMKMENTLRAERDGVVAKINFEPGASLEVDELIMELE